MYGMAGMPDLLPPTGSLQPSIMVLGNQRNGPVDALHNPSQRIVQRAPKLGQIGRSKRVDLDDEDLDMVMNNNRRFPTSMEVSPVA